LTVNDNWHDTLPYIINNIYILIRDTVTFQGGVNLFDHIDKNTMTDNINTKYITAKGLEDHPTELLLSRHIVPLMDMSMSMSMVLPVDVDMGTVRHWPWTTELSRVTIWYCLYYE
jgi:hypothetical protein